jgi:hypothetical protein
MANEQLTIQPNDARMTVIGKSWPDQASDSGGGDWDDTYSGTYSGPIPRTDLPVRIAVTTPPNKTRYNDLEQIDLAGIIVQAYKYDDSIWTSNDYPDGIIPMSELEISPRVAMMAYDKVTLFEFVEKDGWTAEPWPISMDNFIPATWGPGITSGEFITQGISPWMAKREYYHYVFDRAKVACRTQDLIVFLSDEQMPRIVETYMTTEDSEEPAGYKPQYSSEANRMTVNGKDYFCFVFIHRDSTDYVNDAKIPETSVGRYVSYRNYIGWIKSYYGNDADVYSNYDIRVLWQRPGDGARLDTSFTIYAKQPGNGGR